MCDSLPSINDVVDLLGLKRKPGTSRNAVEYQVCCPFCGDTKYHMSINSKKGVYYCFRCSGGETGLGVLDLYGRVRFGEPHVKGQNGMKLLTALCNDLGMGEIPTNVQRREPQPPKPEDSVVLAPDSRLHQVYSALLEFPEFALSPEHREKLRARGLEDGVIETNGYRSMPGNMDWVKKYPWASDIYRKSGLYGAIQKNPALQNIPVERLLAGIIVAQYLTKYRKLSLYGIPGAYKAGGVWMFLYIPGMLIPTRNINGEIVMIQVRRDEGTPRYLSLSSKNLPYSPKGKISRIHFPLANIPASETRSVLLTEGGLKADIAAYLYGQPAFLMAVPGVSNTHELPTVLKQLKDAGVERVQCAFDMDKICNCHVRKASGRINKMVRAARMSMTQIVWDAGQANKMREELDAVCVRHGVTYCRHPNPFIELANMAKALDSAGIAFCETEEGGNTVKHYWCDETKGIDDYLLSLRAKKGPGRDDSRSGPFSLCKICVYPDFREQAASRFGLAAEKHFQYLLERPVRNSIGSTFPLIRRTQIFDIVSADKEILGHACKECVAAESIYGHLAVLVAAGVSDRPNKRLF